MRFTARTKGSQADFSVDISGESCSITFCEGHILYGTRLYFGKEKSTASVGEFTREIKKGTFPATEALIKAVSLLSANEAKGINEENGTKYTIDEMTIMVYYDKDTDTVTGIGTEENGRRFEFTVTDLEPYEAQSNGAGQS